MRKPDFKNLLRVLNREKPERPTLFEFFLNQPLYEELAGRDIVNRKDSMRQQRILIHAFKNAGYDYATIHPPQGMEFPAGEIHHKESISLNEYSSISDRKSFEKYQWPEPESLDYSIYEKVDERQL